MTNFCRNLIQLNFLLNSRDDFQKAFKVKVIFNFTGLHQKCTKKTKQNDGLFCMVYIFPTVICNCFFTVKYFSTIPKTVMYRMLLVDRNGIFLFKINDNLTEFFSNHRVTGDNFVFYVSNMRMVLKLCFISVIFYSHPEHDNIMS